MVLDRVQGFHLKPGSHVRDSGKLVKTMGSQPNLTELTASQLNLKGRNAAFLCFYWELHYFIMGTLIVLCIDNKPESACTCVFAKCDLGKELSPNKYGLRDQIFENMDFNRIL